ncbi:MAG TPA: hypothetical protein PKD68_05020 [Candidatus Saccharibacteria bacterium]|nr:hypothetical protein [Candidatus Saccharibacteria bacterium]
MQNKATFKQVFADRGFLAAWVVSLLVVIAILILSVIEIRPTDLQVPIRYTAFGITNIHRAQWYAELAFPLFALLAMGLHTVIAVRLYALKNRDISRGFMWLTAVVLAIAFLMFSAIFRVISIVD